jgi:hypothetical protein
MKIKSATATQVAIYQNIDSYIDVTMPDGCVTQFRLPPSEKTLLEKFNELYEKAKEYIVSFDVEQKEALI